MKPVPTRDFAIRVSPEYEDVPEAVRPLTAGLLNVRLNWSVDIVFVPFEPPMAPPFPADPTTWTGDREWHTPADARLSAFFGAGLAVTAYDPMAGQEARYPSDYGAPGNPDGIVFYVSAEQYRVLDADLERLRGTHGGWNFQDTALGLQGRPVVDFLTERLQTSRLVPDEALHHLGLRRAVAA